MHYSFCTRGFLVFGVPRSRHKGATLRAPTFKAPCGGLRSYAPATGRNTNPTRQFWCCAVSPAPKRQSPIQPRATRWELPATAIDRTDRSDQSDRSNRKRWLPHLSAPFGARSQKRNTKARQRGGSTNSAGDRVAHTFAQHLSNNSRPAAASGRDLSCGNARKCTTSRQIFGRRCLGLLRSIVWLRDYSSGDSPHKGWPSRMVVGIGVMRTSRCHGEASNRPRSRLFLRRPHDVGPTWTPLVPCHGWRREPNPACDHRGGRQG